MPPLTDDALTISRNARRIYLSPWYKGLRFGFVPALTTVVGWQLWHSNVEYGGFVAAGLVLAAVQAGLWLIPELVDRASGRRERLASYSEGHLRLFLEQRHEFGPGLARVTAGLARWPRQQLVISVDSASGGGRLRTGIHYQPLLTFLRRVDAELGVGAGSAGRDKGAGR